MVSASAADPDGTVSKVDFYQDTTLIGTSTSAPYSITWSNVKTGKYVLTAKATDNDGNTATSPAVNITVDVLPTVSITAPPNNSMSTPPATINLTASASDSDGKIDKVEFYRGAVLVGTDTAAPYEATDPSVATGSHLYTAKAYDDLGGITTSAPITVIVNTLPTVTITTPADNTTLAAPASVNLGANAADADGTIIKVEFYRGTTLIQTDTAPPYQAVDAGLAAGSYVYTAKAYDNLSGVTTSAPVNVTVVAPKTIYFIHADHLNTPRLITNQAGEAVWRWDNGEPFGSSAPDEDPSGLGNFSCNLRFPGQYFDKETNLHYNYFRDFDSAIGRYIQSDPIGLRGGVNTYAYVGSNPLSFSDPKGLQPPSGYGFPWSAAPGFIPTISAPL